MTTDPDQFVKGIDRALVSGVWFSCPYNLNRSLLICDQFNKTRHILYEQIRTFVLCKAACPDNSKHLRIKHFSGLISYKIKKKFFEVFFTCHKLIILMLIKCTDQSFISPVFFILCIGNRDNVTSIINVIPHFIGYLTVDLRYCISDFGATQCTDSETEVVSLFITTELTYSFK